MPAALLVIFRNGIQIGIQAQKSFRTWALSDVLLDINVRAGKGEKKYVLITALHIA